MTILTKDILPTHGPYVEFVNSPARLAIEDGDWPQLEVYRENIFFELADDLIETYCDITNSYCFFDHYDLIQLHHPYDIMKFSSELLTWSFQIARCRPSDFDRLLRIYEKSTRFNEGEMASREHLQQDLLDTLLFLSGKLHQIAFEKRCLIILGI
jgi:hypothetical protein